MFYYFCDLFRCGNALVFLLSEPHRFAIVYLYSAILDCLQLETDSKTALSCPIRAAQEVSDFRCLAAQKKLVPYNSSPTSFFACGRQQNNTPYYVRIADSSDGRIISYFVLSISAIPTTAHQPFLHAFLPGSFCPQMQVMVSTKRMKKGPLIP